MTNVILAALPGTPVPANHKALRRTIGFLFLQTFLKRRACLGSVNLDFRFRF